MEMYDGEGRLLDIDFPRVIFSFVPRGWNASINKKLFGLIYIYIYIKQQYQHQISSINNIIRSFFFHIQPRNRFFSYIYFQ